MTGKLWHHFPLLSVRLSSRQSPFAVDALSNHLPQFATPKAAYPVSMMCSVSAPEAAAYPILKAAT